MLNGAGVAGLRPAGVSTSSPRSSPRRRVEIEPPRAGEAGPAVVGDIEPGLAAVLVALGGDGGQPTLQAFVDAGRQQAMAQHVAGHAPSRPRHEAPSGPRSAPPTSAFADQAEPAISRRPSQATAIAPGCAQAEPAKATGGGAPASTMTCSGPPSSR